MGFQGLRRRRCTGRSCRRFENWWSVRERGRGESGDEDCPARGRAVDENTGRNADGGFIVDEKAGEMRTEILALAVHVGRSGQC